MSAIAPLSNPSLSRAAMPSMRAAGPFDDAAADAVLDVFVRLFTDRTVQISAVPLKSGSHVVPLGKAGQITLEVPDDNHIEATQLTAANKPPTINRGTWLSRWLPVWLRPASKPAPPEHATLLPFAATLQRPITVRAEVHTGWRWLDKLIAGIPAIVSGLRVAADGKMALQGCVKLGQLRIPLGWVCNVTRALRVNMDLQTLLTEGPVRDTPTAAAASLLGTPDPVRTILQTIHKLTGDIEATLKIPDPTPPCSARALTQPDANNPPVRLTEQAHFTPRQLTGKVRVLAEGLDAEVTGSGDLLMGDNQDTAQRWPTSLHVPIEARVGETPSAPWRVRLPQSDFTVLMPKNDGAYAAARVRATYTDHFAPPDAHNAAEALLAAREAFAKESRPAAAKAVRDAEEPLRHVTERPAGEGVSRGPN